MAGVSRRTVAVLGYGALAFTCFIVVLWRESFVAVGVWSLAQFLPRRFSQPLQERAWHHWERLYGGRRMDPEQIPIVHVQEHLHNLLPYLEDAYGSDWRRRPLLLKGLWDANALKDPTRRLSLDGLLQENLTIPYFMDARLKGALTPDARAPVRDIVTNITQHGAPHKIGTQFLVQTYPELVEEVAPVELVTQLFGNYFSPESVQGTGPLHMFPALTTVPVFVANRQQETTREDAMKLPHNNASAEVTSTQPYTALHCEPIGNVAVQLSGEKRWTLVRPEFSYLIRPSTSPDGRAFFASWASDLSHVPVYTVTAKAGDAIWVPTWTWHRVDYNAESEDIAIGGSLFHFRVLDFLRNNPLFAILIVPSLILELIGYNTQ